MIVHVDGTAIDISRTRNTKDNLLIVIKVTGNIVRNYELEVVDYKAMTSRSTVEFAPIHMDSKGNIIVNNHVVITEDNLIRLNDGTFENSAITNEFNAQKILNRTIIDNPIYGALFLAITGKEPESINMLSLNDVNEIISNRDIIPKIWNVKYKGLHIWRLNQREEYVYQAVLRKVYQMVFENLTESRLKYAIRKLNLSKQEAIFNKHQAIAASHKVDIPWEAGMINMLEYDANLIPNDTPQNGNAGLVVAKVYKEQNGKRFSYLQWINQWAENCSPNRQIVARYVTQICELTNRNFKDNLVNLFAARMTYMGYTLEDGCVISETTAEKFRCYDINIDRFIVRNPKLTVQPLANFDAYMYEYLIQDDAPFVNRGYLGTYNGDNEIRSKYYGIVTNIDITETEIEGEYLVIVETTSVLRLREGDKLADLHGNKVTVTKILPSELMPRACGKYLDIIVPPWIGKRGSASRLKEEEHSTVHNVAVVTDSLNDTFYQDVAVGHVTYIRLSQHAKKKLNYSHKTETNYMGLVPKGYGLYSFADAMYHMEAVGAKDLMMEILNRTYDTNSPELLNQHLKCFGFELIKGRITGLSKTPFFTAPDNDIILDKFVNAEEIATLADPTGTVLDPRILYSHSWIRIPEGLQLTFHALTSQLRIHSYDHEYVTHKLVDDMSWMKRYDISFGHLMTDGKKQVFIRIPPGLRTWTTKTDTVTLSDIQHQLNQLIMQLKTYEQTRFRAMQFDPSRRINMLVNKLLDSMLSRIFTKSGLLRNTIHPRTKFSMNAVLGSNPELPLDTCEIPLEAFHDYLKDEEFRKAYGLSEIEDPDIGEINFAIEKMDARCLVMRNPAHQVRNCQGMRFRVWAGNSIRINPAIVKVFDKQNNLRMC